MSAIHIDLKFISYLSSKLPLLKKKSDYLYNFRCPLCGDSSKKKNKARGYIFRLKNEMLMKCHNCGASMKFSSFLKILDGHLYSEYVLERYSSEVSGHRLVPPENIPEIKEPEVPETLLDRILDRLDILSADHPAREFCRGRLIPDQALSRIYYTDNVGDIEQLSERYKSKINGSDPRIVFPIYDDNEQLSAVTCRSIIKNPALRYITIKVKEDTQLVFGTECLDKTKKVYVLEGPIDSLFLPNSIAVIGTAFTKVRPDYVSNMILVLDNQPRNKEVCAIYSKMIDLGHKVTIWPQYIAEKDVNEMVLAGRTAQEVQTIIDKNSCSGLMAKAKFSAWKMC